MPPLRSLPVARWGVLCALLFVEVMFLTVRFDTIALYQMQGWWAGLMRESWIIPHVCVAVSAALVLFSDQPMRAEFQRIGVEGLQIGNLWRGLAIQITVYLILLGSYGSADIAMGGFHSQAGWLALNMVALGTVVFAGRSQLISGEVPQKKTVNYTAAYLGPMLIIALVIILTQVITHSGFDYYYPVRFFAAAGVLCFFRKAYQGLSWRCSWEAVAAGVGVFVLWMALEPANDQAANEAFGASLRGMGTGWASCWLFFRVVGSVVTVPIAEELAFRGYLSRRLIAVEFQDVPLGKFTWFSFVLSSVAFGILHDRWFAGTLAGLAFALVLYRHKRLSDPIWAHAITNGLIAAYVLFTSTWTMW
jgi:CAAX prenyl protease-like protein